MIALFACQEFSQGDISQNFRILKLKSALPNIVGRNRKEKSIVCSAHGFAEKRRSYASNRFPSNGLQFSSYPTVDIKRPGRYSRFGRQDPRGSPHARRVATLDQEQPAASQGLWGSHRG